ncbi:MAG: M20/M25/M40 family metallo-hydrolase [Bacteroidota bacterium]
MRKIIKLLVLSIFTLGSIQAQDSLVIKAIYDDALTSTVAYEQLRYLCSSTKGRIAGSAAAAEAIEYTRQELILAGADTVYLQPVMVPNWKRGTRETARLHSGILGDLDLSVAALGLSIGTPPEGITARVIEVQNFAELEALGKKKISGKIVFFNRPMDPTLINTFEAYGGAVDQRTRGAAEAGKYGAVAVIERSQTTGIDDFPHTGVMRYADEVEKIPAVAVSTMDADQLSRWIAKDPEALLTITTACRLYPDVLSYNVIAELKGSLYPDRYITVGGHLDAWDIGEGAHDDGAGCVQAMDLIRIYRKLGLRPQNTIRVVLFMDEEIAQRGGRAYAEAAREKGERHLFALESDEGCLVPEGFGFTLPENADKELLDKFLSLKEIFRPFGLYSFTSGGGGVDIRQLGKQGAVLSSLQVNPQRYFDYHHSPNDTFDQINLRELQLGTAAIASLIWLVDKIEM